MTPYIHKVRQQIPWARTHLLLLVRIYNHKQESKLKIGIRLAFLHYTQMCLGLAHVPTHRGARCGLAMQAKKPGVALDVWVTGIIQ